MLRKNSAPLISNAYFAFANDDVVSFFPPRVDGFFARVPISIPTRRQSVALPTIEILPAWFVGAGRGDAFCARDHQILILIQPHFQFSQASHWPSSVIAHKLVRISLMNCSIGIS